MLIVRQVYEAVHSAPWCDWRHLDARYEAVDLDTGGGNREPARAYVGERVTQRSNTMLLNPAAVRADQMHILGGRASPESGLFMTAELVHQPRAGQRM